jgi:hypothetical protein
MVRSISSKEHSRYLLSRGVVAGWHGPWPCPTSLVGMVSLNRSTVLNCTHPNRMPPEFIRGRMSLDKYMEITGEHTPNTFCLKIFLYLTAVPFVVLLVMAKKLCKNILYQNPFCQSSIKSLNVISICALSIFCSMPSVRFSS